MNVKKNDIVSFNSIINSKLHLLKYLTYFSHNNLKSGNLLENADNEIAKFAGVKKYRAFLWEKVLLYGKPFFTQ